jgi:hypothetical protein
LLTETQRIVGSLKSCNCTLLNSESGSKETKFTPASLSPTMIYETASSFIAITQPRTNTELDDFGFANTKIRIRIPKSQILRTLVGAISDVRRQRQSGCSHHFSAEIYR